MPLSTNLSVAPYFDDYDVNSEYYRILFKPATAVQVREMNQMQAILQNQIEQFGDHIIRSGSILSGCQFDFNYSMPYVKILDKATQGAAVDVLRYTGYFAEGATNGVKAKITHTIAGFEGSDPDLNTLYLNYISGGTNGDVDSFVENEVLRIYSGDDRLHDIIVNDPSSGFSNSDTVIILSAIEVANATNSEGGFSSPFIDGETLVDNVVSPTVRVQIYDTPEDIDEDNSVLLRIKPLDSDMAPSPNATYWENLEEAGTLIGLTSGNEATLTRFRGEGATGKITTSRTGSIASADISTGGIEYDILPFVGIYSTTATTLQVGQLDLQAQDYVTQVRVGTGAQFTDPIGYGFGVKVSEGQIYQKGHFMASDAQFIVASKYSNTPSDLSVGFSTTESITNVFTDSTLYDNARGFSNEGAPGANRLKLTPTLVSRTTTEEESDPAYLPLVKFSEGRPYSLNEMTQYAQLGEMIAQRTYEESGNYTLDPFKIVTRSANDFTDSDESFTYVIDPGHAYVNGYRVKTVQNFAKTVAKGTETKSETAVGQDLDYGNYIIVNNLVGALNFKNADSIELRDTAGTFLDAETPAPSQEGSLVGTARVRSVTYEQGIQGTIEGQYRLYLFDISMNAGKNFKRDVRSIYAVEGSLEAAADLVLSSGNEFVLRTLRSEANQLDENGDIVPLTYTQLAEVKSPLNQSLLISTSKPVVYSGSGLSNIEYTYRTASDDLLIGATGQISVSAQGTATFPYIDTLTTVQRSEVIIIPTDSDVRDTVAFGTSALTVDSAGADSEGNIKLTASSGIFGGLEVGDWFQGAAGKKAQIQAIVGADAVKVKVRTNVADYPGQSSEALYRVHPVNVPVSRFTATCPSPYTSLVIDLGLSGVNGGQISNGATVVYLQKYSNVAEVSMTPRRSRFVRLTTAGAFKGNTPRSLGIPGIFRLRKVYNGTTTSDADITSEFYVDSGQTANYWGLGKLFRTDDASTTLAGTILVEVDYFNPTARGGLKTIDSYPIDDEKTLSELTSNGTVVHNIEVPIISVGSGEIYDLRESLDFRPFVDQTAADITDPTDAGITTDPSDVVAFTGATGLQFPRPEGDVIFDITYNLPRQDEIYVDVDGDFTITSGTTKVANDPNSIMLYRADVPAYPSFPQVQSTQLKEIADVGVINGRETNSIRENKYLVKVNAVASQNEGYTMQEISSLERRIEALENVQNISDLEESVKNRKMPSSIDSSLERYKFGFFVDNFEDFNLSNLSSPEYDASIYEYVLQPSKSTSTLRYKLDKNSQIYANGGQAKFPYKRKTIVNQAYATYGPYVPEPQLPKIRYRDKFTNNRNMKSIGDSTAPYSQLQNVWEEATVVAPTFSDNKQRLIFVRFFVPTGKVGFEIIQSKTPPTAGFESGTVLWSSASSTPTDITPNKYGELYRKNYPVKNSKNIVYSRDINPWALPKASAGQLTFTTDSGSITYNTFTGAYQATAAYNHTQGTYITVRALKGDAVFNFQITYPAITSADPIFDTGANEVNVRPPAKPRGTFLYKKCSGTDLIVYRADGNYGSTKDTVRNSKECGYVEPIIKLPPILPPPVIGSPGGPPAPQPDPPQPEPEPPQPPVTPACPASGTVAKTVCSKTPDKTLTTYVYTGKRSSTTGKCDIRVSESDVNNVEVCRYSPPPPVKPPVCVILPPPVIIRPPPVVCGPMDPPDNDDGCVIIPEPTPPKDPVVVHPPVRPPVIVIPEPPVLPPPKPPVLPPPPANITISDAVIREGETGEVEVYLSRKNRSDTTVNYSMGGGTATAGNDYVAESGTLRIPKGQQTGKISVQALADGVSNEGTQTFNVTISSASQGTITDSVGVVSITDTTSTPIVSIPKSRAINEGGGTLNVPITLSGISASNVTINYQTTSGGATSGSDFTPTSGTATITAGQLTTNISIPITDDTIDESAETFRLNLTGATNATVGSSSCLITIQDNDPTPAPVPPPKPPVKPPVPQPPVLPPPAPSEPIIRTEPVEADVWVRPNDTIHAGQSPDKRLDFIKITPPPIVPTVPVTPAAAPPVSTPNNFTGAGSGCFQAGTKIMLHDYSYKNVEDIEVGDIVMGAEGVHNTVDEVYDIAEDLRPMANVNGLHLTDYHPILTTEGWKAVNPVTSNEHHPDLNVGQLEIGDEIVSITGPESLVASEIVVNIDKYNSTDKVYNFKVDNDNTYTANNLVVHNKLFTFNRLRLGRST